MSIRRIYSVDSFPKDACEEVEMRVDVNRSRLDIINTIEQLIRWCLDMGVKKVRLNDMNSVKLARNISQDRLDIEYDEKKAGWDTNDTINYII